MADLKPFPGKEMRKFILLKNIINHFEEHREYNENEVNEIIKRIYADYAVIPH